jgi:hypothetical protein
MFIVTALRTLYLTLWYEVDEVVDLLYGISFVFLKRMTSGILFLLHW